MYENQGGSGAVRSTGLRDLVADLRNLPSDWTEMQGGEHFVQFYETDEFIVDAVSAYLVHGLNWGQVCIVAATAPHLEVIEKQLRTVAHDFERALDEGRYISLEAGATLARFMVDGIPAPERFSSVIGDLVKTVSGKGRGIRVFGEMVGVLGGEGNFEGAVLLEELWNQLRASNPFSLFCGYPVSALGTEAAGQNMAHICESHGRVLPSESFTQLRSPEKRLQQIAMLQQTVYQLTVENDELKHRLAELETKARTN